MKKIIHLSDLHIGHRNLAERFEHIVSRISEGYDPDEHVIVITGDIVENANNGYAQAAHFVRELRQKHRFTTLVAPGNHDYGTGNLADRKFVAQFWETFMADQTEGGPKYPVVNDVDGIRFIALDSTQGELDFPDALSAEGELTDAQLHGGDPPSLKSSGEAGGGAGLAQILQQTDTGGAIRHIVVYLHHHPFDPYARVRLPEELRFLDSLLGSLITDVAGFFHRLKDSEALGRILKQHNEQHGVQVAALLYGHNHAGLNANGDKNPWGIERGYDAGTSTRKDDMACVHRIIDLSHPPADDERTCLLADGCGKHPDCTAALNNEY